MALFYHLYFMLLGVSFQDIQITETFLQTFTSAKKYFIINTTQSIHQARLFEITCYLCAIMSQSYTHLYILHSISNSPKNKIGQTNKNIQTSFVRHFPSFDSTIKFIKMARKYVQTPRVNVDKRF